MSSQTDAGDTSAPDHRQAMADTLRGVAERLHDPYLTDHDRWVLRQFARFLGGAAPDPDSRAIPARSPLGLHRVARRPRV